MNRLKYLNELKTDDCGVFDTRLICLIRDEKERGCVIHHISSDGEKHRGRITSHTIDWFNERLQKDFVYVKHTGYIVSTALSETINEEGSFIKLNGLVLGEKVASSLRPYLHESNEVPDVAFLKHASLLRPITWIPDDLQLPSEGKTVLLMYRQKYSNQMDVTFAHIRGNSWRSSHESPPIGDNYWAEVNLPEGLGSHCSDAESVVINTSVY